jgi:hypothetical protein
VGGTPIGPALDADVGAPVGSVVGRAVGWEVDTAVGWDVGAEVGEAGCAAAADGDRPDPYAHWGVVEALAHALSIKAVAARATALRRLRPNRGTETSPTCDRGLGVLGCGMWAGCPRLRHCVTPE